MFCILIIVFPLYKFSIFNSGIGRFDTFPSIINPYYKKDIDWFINPNKLANCMNTKIESSDMIVIRYLSIKLNYLGYKFNNGFYVRNHKNSSAPKKYCTIKLVNSNFIVNE